VLDLADRDLAAPLDGGRDGATALAAPSEAEVPPLAAESTHGAVRGSLESLALAAEAGPSADGVPQASGTGDAPFEALVREMLRPALAEWLDRNLPPMVERLVAAEIARIVGKRG
jgi:cell pole-organizing protein PopZ